MRVLLAGVLAALVLAPAAGAWGWPVNGDVLKPFVFDHDHPYAAGQHRGIDIAADTGTTVNAPASGTVSFAGTVPTSGKTVTIQTADGYAVTLVHLGSYSVSKDASVAEGDAVGTVGPSGIPDETVPYVYLGVRHADDAQGYVDPLMLLPDPTSSPPASSDDPQPADVPVVADGSGTPSGDTPSDPPGANSVADGNPAPASTDDPASTDTDVQAADDSSSDDQTGVVADDPQISVVEPDASTEAQDPADATVSDPAPAPSAGSETGQVESAPPTTTITGPQPVSGGETPPPTPAQMPPVREDANGTDPASPATHAGQVEAGPPGGESLPVPPGGWHVGYPHTDDPTQPAAAPSSNGVQSRPLTAVTATSVPPVVVDDSSPASHAVRTRSAAAPSHARPPEPATTRESTPTAARTRSRGGHVQPHASLTRRRPTVGGMWPGRAPEVNVRRVAATTAPVSTGGHEVMWLFLAPALATGLALAAGGAVRCRRKRPPSASAPALESSREEARIMFQPPRLDLEAHLAGPVARTHSRRGRVAVRVRPPAHRPCRRVRAVGRVRPLSPPVRKQGAHGLRDRRARHADHGHRRPRRAVSA